MKIKNYILLPQENYMLKNKIRFKMCLVTMVYNFVYYVDVTGKGRISLS